MSTIITRNSANSGSIPSSLTQGELAINVTDGRLFYGSGSGNVVKEFTSSGSGGGAIDTGSFATTGSNIFIGNQIITGSLHQSGTFYPDQIDWFSSSIGYDTGSYILTTTINGLTTYAGYGDVADELALYMPTVSASVSASYAATASNILGGKATHVPYFITDTTLATSSIYQSGSTSIIINQDNNTTANPEALYVWQPSTSSFNVISGKGNLDNYLQLNIQNTNQGTIASSDVVATADNGNELINYIDMGINSENFSGDIGGPNAGYLYSTGQHLHIGNASNYPIQFFAGGLDSDVNKKLQLSPNNYHEMTGSLDISGSVKAFSFTGSLQGNATSATTSQTSSYSTTLGASLSQPANNQVRLLNSAGGTLSTATVNNVTSASHADNASTADYATTAGNGGVTQIIAGSGISLIPISGQGAVTVIASGGGGVTIISGSLVTGSFVSTTSYTFNHNLSTRTPIITVFDSNYNQIIPQNIELVNTSSAVITFPTQESGFAIGSTGGTTGTALSSSYALFSEYANTASFYAETDPVFVAKSGSFATTGSNVFKGNQTITGSLIISSSNSMTVIGPSTITGSLLVSGSTTQIGNNTLIGNTILSGSLNVSGSQVFKGDFDLTGSFTVTGSTTQIGNNSLTGNTSLSGSITISGSTTNTIIGNTNVYGEFNVSGSSVFSNSIFVVTGSTFVKGVTNISGSTNITGSLNVIGDVNVVSGSGFYRWGNKLFNYAQFAETASLPITANVSASFFLPTTYFNEGISIVSGSRITFANTGLYNTQFSAVVDQGAGKPNFSIWFKKNGLNIDNSNTIATLEANSTALLAWNFAYPFNAGDYVEMWYHTSANNTSLSYHAAANGFPAPPSLIVTVTQIA